VKWSVKPVKPVKPVLEVMGKKTKKSKSKIQIIAVEFKGALTSLNP